MAAAAGNGITGVGHAIGRITAPGTGSVRYTTATDGPQPHTPVRFFSAFILHLFLSPPSLSLVPDSLPVSPVP